METILAIIYELQHYQPITLLHADCCWHKLPGQFPSGIGTIQVPGQILWCIRTMFVLFHVHWRPSWLLYMICSITSQSPCCMLTVVGINCQGSFHQALGQSKC